MLLHISLYQQVLRMSEIVKSATDIFEKTFNFFYSLKAEDFLITSPGIKQLL